MTNRSSRFMQGALFLAPIIISLLISALLVIAVGRDPFEVAQLILEGAFRNNRSFAGVLNFFISLTLVSMGLVVTFRAGLWNIGVEGQMMMGAVFASIIPMAFLQNTHLDSNAVPSFLLLLGSVLLAGVGGILWGLLVGFLKIQLGINEIFGGVALNALANVFSIYLISGPWEPDIGGSAQGTAPFPPATLYPQISNDFPTSLLALIIVAIAFVAIFFALNGTRWGLNLKAVGKNTRSALLLGVPTRRVALSAFVVCGALAGIAGSYRALFTFDSLRPLASGGIGFLGLLVVLLVSVRALWVPIIAFAFAAILSGSTRLRISLQLDSSLASVLQGTLVLLVLLFKGVREVWGSRIAGDGEDSADQQRSVEAQDNQQSFNTQGDLSA
ncbi:MAG: ABC transporter permease [Chloroflexi bacterium]|nr:ABC transporter permease [Chloroflexota bacterium]